MVYGDLQIDQQRVEWAASRVKAPGHRQRHPVKPQSCFECRLKCNSHTVELAIPKLRTGSYFPDWLLQHRRRAEQALVSVVATSYLLGVSTRRVDKLVGQLGVASLSKSPVSEMAAHLDAQVEAFRQRPLDAGPYTFVWCDALTFKVREAGRTVNVHALIAVGVNADGVGVRSSAWTWPRPRTARAGWHSCAV